MRVMVGTTVLLGAVLIGATVRSSAQSDVRTTAPASAAAMAPVAFAAPGQGRGPQQAPKNIQVLPKDWTSQQVQQYMRNTVVAGLGVQCNYCHVADRSADDMKTKLTARKMIAMTMAINDTYLKDVGEAPAAGASKVTCYTCHRGTTKPLTAPPTVGGH